jgi:hypothetical protein
VVEKLTLLGEVPICGLGASEGSSVPARMDSTELRSMDDVRL